MTAQRQGRVDSGTRRLDHLTTAEVTVDGRRVSYASGGAGLPVVFLHGWGLDHSVYRPALRRLVTRGCHVIAPSLPGFGNTAELPPKQRSLEGYAAWVAQFLEELEVEEPVLVLGHSFGGGVATRFAYDFTDRVRYLVLLNSVGDPSSFPLTGVRRLKSFGLADAARQVRNLTKITPRSITSAIAAQEAFVTNIVRNPMALAQVAWIAMSADLSFEMSELAERHLPVLVLWSEQDGVIPMAAFDTFCSAFGTDGHVVSGGHSWLLANPDVFGEVLDNVIQVQITEHGSQTATANTGQLRELLRPTSVPRRVVMALLDGVSPLWVMSEAPAVLAADLALCHPRLRPGEVRAVARAMPAPNTFRLTVVAKDRRGLLADTAATLASERISIVAASVTTWPDEGLALHSMTVHSDTGFDEQRWSTIGERLREMASGRPPLDWYLPTGRASVSRTGEADGKSVVRVTAPDRLGLLSSVSRWFADHEVSIEAADIHTTNGVVRDVFLVDGEFDIGDLERHLSGPSPTITSRFVGAFGSLLPCLHLRC